MTYKRQLTAAISSLTIFAVSTVHSYQFEKVSPEDVGFDSSKLNEADKVSDYIKNKFKDYDFS